MAAREARAGSVLVEMGALSLTVLHPALCVGGVESGVLESAGMRCVEVSRERTSGVWGTTLTCVWALGHLQTICGARLLER
jgi:hypothetical protein